MNAPHAAKIERAAVRQATLRTALPQDIAWGVTVAAGGNVWFRGVLVGGFTDDGTYIVGWEPDCAPVPVTDAKALTILFRGIFFPADYTDPLTACDVHNELMAAYAAGDDAGVAEALKALDTLKAPVAVA